MITIFALPKPFRGHIEVIQSNAIQSWLLLRPACEVILFGNEEGTAEAASKFGIRHIPEVDCNEYGTPLVSSVFSVAQDVARHQLMSYVNADVILTSDFLTAVQQVCQQKRQFLIIGQRWDLDVKEPLDFTRPDWEKQLRASVANHGKFHSQKGIDYFVFSCNIWGEIPPFAIGRTAWDNWFVYRARSLGRPVVDATKAITAVHQNHDYSHHLMGEDGVWKGAEAKRNRELLGGKYRSFNMLDATHLLTPDGLKPAMSMKHLRWRLERLPEVHPHMTPIAETIMLLRALKNALAPAYSRLRELMSR